MNDSKKYWLMAALFVAIGTDHAYAQGLSDKSRLSVYETTALDTKNHVIIVDLANRIVAAGQTRDQAKDFVAMGNFIQNDRRDPPNVREWSEAGTCGVQVDAMAFAVPPAGERSTEWEGWTFVAAKIDIEPLENVIVAVEREHGEMIRFSYDTNRGVYKFLLYDFPGGETTTEYKLASGPGLLANCLSKRPN